MYSIYFCDTETSGLINTPGINGSLDNTCDVLEVCLWRMGEPESKTWWTKPLNPENIEDKALKINGHKREDILWLTKEGREKYREPSIVLPEIEEWIMQDAAAAEERVFIGQNPEFDYRFLANLWQKVGAKDNFPFGFWRNKEENVGYTLDTIQLVRFIDVMLGKKRKFYNLGSLVKDFGVKKVQAHRADGDVQMTKELFEKIAEVFKDPAKAFADCYK